MAHTSTHMHFHIGFWLIVPIDLGYTVVGKQVDDIAKGNFYILLIPAEVLLHMENTNIGHGIEHNSQATEAINRLELRLKSSG